MFINTMKIDIDNIETYNYDLPLERIAEYPLALRDQSKLLVYTDEIIRFAKVYNCKITKDYTTYTQDNNFLIY